MVHMLHQTHYELINRFRNRYHAGQELVARLREYATANTMVLALPRGGIVVGYEVARGLRLKFDVIVSKKISMPDNPEFAVGAVAENGVTYIHHDAVTALGLSTRDILPAIDRARAEVEQNIRTFRSQPTFPDITGKKIILVDDGLATGATAMAAIEAIKKSKPKSILFAVPVCSSTTATLIGAYVDRMVCVLSSDSFTSVGLYYLDFSPTTDDEAEPLLRELRGGEGKLN